MASAATYEVSQNDLVSLRRVFDFLADFAPKHKIRRELQPKLERRSKLALFKKNPDAVKIVDETGAELPSAVVDLEDARLSRECAELEGLIDTISAKPDTEKKINPRDLHQALEFLGKLTDKKEVRAALLILEWG
jgi:chromosomal replication initiation ATPase DnaA